MNLASANSRWFLKKFPDESGLHTHANGKAPQVYSRLDGEMCNTLQLVLKEREIESDEFLYACAGKPVRSGYKKIRLPSSQ